MLYVTLLFLIDAKAVLLLKMFIQDKKNEIDK